MSSSTTTNNNSSKSLLLTPPRSDSKAQNLNQNVSPTIKNPQSKPQNPAITKPEQLKQQPTNKKSPSCLYRLFCCCCACADSTETSTNTTNSTTTSTSSRNSNRPLTPNRQTNAKIPKSAKSLPVKSNQPKPQPKIITANKKQPKQNDSKNKIPLKTLPPNKNNKNKRTSKNNLPVQSNLRLPRIQLARPSLHPPERSLSCAHLESVLCATKTSSAGQPSSRTLVLLSNLSRSASTPNFAKHKYVYKNSKQVIPATRTSKQVPPPRSATIDNVDDDEYDEDDDCGIYCGGPHRLDDRFKNSKNPTTSSDPVPVPLKSSGGEECTSKLVFSTSYSSREGSCYLMESPPEYPIAERAVDVGWVGGWASDFDILLSDPIGIKAFTDFLRKEFSYENLQFFLTVQEFKKLINQVELREQANEIYQNFISSAAAEPVNVDSRARKATEIGLKTEPLTNRIFALPEKQIYNLMKFDSYQRFLKSEIYKECALLELQGKPLPYESTDSPANGMANSSGSRSGHSSPKQQQSQDGPVKQPKSKRKSLIPWARIKNSITSNTKAASLSSMPSHKESSFKRPMMMRKITNSITKIRSKSLDDHITSHINNSKHHHLTNNANNSSGDSTGSAGSGAAAQNGGHATATAHAHPPPAGHSSSVDKAVNQKSLCDSRSSLIHPGVGSDSIDLSENNNVFSPSPDNAHESGGGMSRVASLSNESATSTDASPVSAGPVASSFNHNCNRDNCHFLRVVFPDRSQTVVPSTPNETIETLLRRLLDKRGLRYLAYDVFVTGVGVEEPKALDPGTNINSLGCTELRVEQRVLFQMDFPDGEVVGIKTRPNRKCGDVFKSVLVNYGYRPEHVMVVISESNIPPDLSLPVASIDGLNIIVNYRDDLEEWGWDPTPGRNNIPAALNASLKSSGSKDSPNKAADRSMGPGEDTQSDSFYREIIGSDPNSPPTNSALTSPFKIVSPAILQQIRLQQQQQMQHQLQQMQHLPAQQASPQSHQGSHQSTSSAAYGILSVKPSNQRSLEETSSTVSAPTSNASPPRRLNSASTDQQPQYFPAGNPRFHNSRIPNEIDLDSVTTQQNQNQIQNNSINSAPVNQSAARTKASHLRELQNHQNFKSYLDGGAGATGSTVSGTTLPYNHETTANRIYNMTTNTTPYQGDLNSDEIQKQNQNSVASTFHQVPPPPMPLSMATHHHAHASESSPPPEKPPLRRFQSEQQKTTSTPPPPLPPKSTTSNSIVSQSITPQSTNPPPPRPPPLANVVTGGSLGSAAPQASSIAFTNTTAHHHHHHPHHPSLYNNHHMHHGHHHHHHNHHHHHQLSGSGGSAKAGPIPGGVYQEATVSSGEASYV